EFMKRIWKVILWVVGLILAGIIGILIAFKISVKPGVFIIRHMFDAPVTIMDESNYEKAASRVNKLEDVMYESNFNNNTLDIYYPKEKESARPVLFWVHGGGYVSGDKKGVEEFATYIAANNQIAVVAINYETAPELQYPGQVHQL